MENNMRFLGRLIMTLVGIVAFFAMVAFGGLYAYGAYGTPLVEAQIANVEQKIEENLEEEHPGADVVVNIEGIFYKLEGIKPIVVFEVDATATLGGVLQEDTTQYIQFDLTSIISGTEEFEVLDETEWNELKADFKVAPELLFDGEKAKSTAITYLIISGAVFVGSILVKVIVFRKKRI